jgi:N-methylhydantoinase B
VVPAASTLVLETPGGAGIGLPADREAAELTADLESGFVSERAAAESYGSSTEGKES